MLDKLIEAALGSLLLICICIVTIGWGGVLVDMLFGTSLILR